MEGSHGAVVETSRTLLNTLDLTPNCRNFAVYIVVDALNRSMTSFTGWTRFELIYGSKSDLSRLKKFEAFGVILHDR